MAMTESDRSAIVGIFEDQVQADKAMNDLRAAGFSTDQINMETHSTSVGDENIPVDESATGSQGPALEGLLPGNVLSRKTQLSRIVVTVQAPGREQEALAILHRNGANNANIPDALESEIAPVLGIETDQTSGQQRQVPSTTSTDDFFSGPEEHETPPAP